MDNSSSFSSQPRSFLFLLEPIRASTEKAWALELRAAADRLLSLISLKSTRNWGEGGGGGGGTRRLKKNKKQKHSVRPTQCSETIIIVKKSAHVSVYSAAQTHQVSKVIPTVTRNAAPDFRRQTVPSWPRMRSSPGRLVVSMRSSALRVSQSFHSAAFFLSFCPLLTSL